MLTFSVAVRKLRVKNIIESNLHLSRNSDAALGLRMHEWPVIFAYSMAANVFLENYRLHVPQDVSGRGIY